MRRRCAKALAVIFEAAHRFELARVHWLKAGEAACAAGDYRTVPGHILGTLLYSLPCTHCMTVSLAQGGLGVGAMWGESLTREFLANAGFSRVQRHILPHDIQNDYYLVKP